MPMSLKAIDRLFDRLSATYGKHFAELYAGLDIQSVKTAWALELDHWGTEEGLKSIAWALENLPDYAPNAIQFKRLVRSAPAPELPRLPEPKADPARLKSELEKLGGIVGQMKNTATNGKDWARRIIEREAQGAKIHRATLQMAREALNMKGAS